MSPAAEPTWPQLIGRLTQGQDLDAAAACWAMDQVMAGGASPVHLAAFLVALRAKGEVLEEVMGLAASVLNHAVAIDVNPDAVDIVGTGGDQHHTVNISTMAAVVIAGTGTRVIKHGNRAASSSSGSADVLEALGIRLDLPPQRAAEVVDEAGITFLFAQTFHPAFRHAGPIRRELGIPTVFNIMGPLSNPARPHATAFGAADAQLAPLIAGVFAQRRERALVFCSEDGLDELSTTAPAQVWSVNDGAVGHERIDPAADLDLPRAQIADLRGGDAARNAQIFRDVLHGQSGPIRDVVLLNAAAGLVAYGRASGTGSGSAQQRLSAELQVARASIDDGSAAEVLDRWIAVTNS